MKTSAQIQLEVGTLRALSHTTDESDLYMQIYVLDAALVMLEDSREIFEKHLRSRAVAVMPPARDAIIAACDWVCDKPGATAPSKYWQARTKTHQSSPGEATGSQ